jgi:hypothetical protein
MDKRSKTIYHVHKKNGLTILGELLNLFLIGASVYYTYRMLFTPYVQRARVDWQVYTAEVTINGKEYYLKSIDDEVEVMNNYYLKFDEVVKGDINWKRLVIEHKGNVEVIQKYKY